MGTSTRWPGPGGQEGAAREWSRLSRRASGWRPERPGALDALDDIAADCLGVLHQTLREDRTAFGLYEAARTAGERLTDVLAAGVPSEGGTAYAIHFTSTVGGTGGTVADAAVRRAAASSARRLLEQFPGVSTADASTGRSLTGELFCRLYQGFFADLVAEFVRTVIAEKIKLTAPLLPVVDPDDHIAGWVAEHVLQLLPSPCEEAAHLTEAASEEPDVQGLADSLPGIARRLVPRAVGGALGLLTETGTGEAPAATPYEGEPAA